MKTEEKFKIKNLVNRLQGCYPVGPILENGEPEFGWKDCSATLTDGTKIPTPIMLEAALVLDQLSNGIDILNESNEKLKAQRDVFKVMANSNTGVYGKFGNVDPAKLEAEHDAAMYGDGFYKVEFVNGVRVSTRIDPANVELPMEDNKYIIKTPTEAKTSYSSIVDNIITWRKGCSSAPDNDPYQCKECTLALISALAAKAIRLDETEPVWLTISNGELIEDPHQGNFGPYFKEPVGPAVEPIKIEPKETLPFSFDDYAIGTTKNGISLHETHIERPLQVPKQLWYTLASKFVDYLNSKKL